MSTLLLLGALLWVGLAIAVGFHANGHNRSTLFWSVLTLVFGIFGVMVYLLFITSKGTKTPETGIDTSTEFAYVFTAVGGAVAAAVPAYAFTAGVRILTLPPITAPGYRTSPLDPIFPFLITIATLGGLVAGPLLFHDGGTERFLAGVSNAPPVLLGLVGFPFLVSVVGEAEGLFYGGYRTALAPVVLLLVAALSAEGWRAVRGRIPVVETLADGDDRESPRQYRRSRRAFLGVAGVATAGVLGYGALGENPHREEAIRDNEVTVPDGYELSDLSHGYFQNDDEYRVTGTVTTTKEVTYARADVDWYVGTGVSYGSTSSSLDFGFFGGEEAELEAVVESDSSFSFEPSEIERFELEIHERRY